MTAPRLASHVLVAGLLRAAEAQGGFGAVLVKGDRSAGAVALLILERGTPHSFLERRLGAGGDYRWEPAGAAIDPESTRALVERRRRADPDLWVVELDVPGAERFVAEMNALD